MGVEDEKLCMRDEGEISESRTLNGRIWDWVGHEDEGFKDVVWLEQ